MERESFPEPGDPFDPKTQCDKSFTGVELVYGEERPDLTIARVDQFGLRRGTRRLRPAVFAVNRSSRNVAVDAVNNTLLPVVDRVIGDRSREEAADLHRLRSQAAEFLFLPLEERDSQEGSKRVVESTGRSTSVHSYAMTTPSLSTLCEPSKCAVSSGVADIRTSSPPSTSSCTDESNPKAMIGCGHSLPRPVAESGTVTLGDSAALE